MFSRPPALKPKNKACEDSHLGSPNLLLSKFLQGSDEHFAGILNLERKSRGVGEGDREAGSVKNHSSAGTKGLRMLQYKISVSTMVHVSPLPYT